MEGNNDETVGVCSTCGYGPVLIEDYDEYDGTVYWMCSICGGTFLSIIVRNATDSMDRKLASSIALLFNALVDSLDVRDSFESVLLEVTEIQ